MSVMEELREYQTWSDEAIDRLQKDLIHLRECGAAGKDYFIAVDPLELIATIHERDKTIAELRRLLKSNGDHHGQQPQRLEALNTLWRELQEKNRAHHRAEQFADYTGRKSPEEHEEFHKAIADWDEASRRFQEAMKALETMDREWEEEAEKGDDGRRTPSDPTPSKQGNRGTMEDI